MGLCRSCVTSQDKNTATIQPFYTLQLDIQDQAIKSITNALRANFSGEQLDSFICDESKQGLYATRYLTLEKLPPVLILHLKRFVYDSATGLVQKIMKPVEFETDLEIEEAVLSAECRVDTTARSRQYELFSVVYHNGREATQGHYVTDVFHQGHSSWLHCNDSIVKTKTKEQVLAPSFLSTPYILFYRRRDTNV